MCRGVRSPSVPTMPTPFRAFRDSACRRGALPRRTRSRSLLAAATAAALLLTGCTSTLTGSGLRTDATAAQETNGADGTSSTSAQANTEDAPKPDGTATAADLPAIMKLSDADQQTWTRRESMAFELNQGDTSGLVAAVGGRDAYAQVLVDQAAFFAKQLGAPGYRRPAHALGDGDINDPSTQVGLGQMFGAPGGGGQDVGEQEWDSGERGERTDPNNPNNTVNIDDNTVDSTVHLDPYDNAKVHTEVTMRKHSEMCPDPRGRMKADYTFDIDSVSKTGGGNYHGTWIVGITAQLDEDAQIVSIDMDFLYQNGGSAGGGEELSGHWSAGADSAEPIKDGKGFAFVAMMSKQFQAKNVEEGLKRTIERGKCVKLGLSPSDGPDGLDTDTEVTITSTPTAVMDGAPAKGTVKATLTGGTQSVSPDGQKQPSNPSVTVTYKSAKGQDQTGTVSFEARSLRGVGKEQMTLTTGQCIVGTWAMDNDSWNAIVEPMAAASGGTMTASGGPILTTFRKDGTWDFTFNGFSTKITVEGGEMTGAYTGKDSGTWKRADKGTYTITSLKAGVHLDAVANVGGMSMRVPSDYNAALQPNTVFTCQGDVITVQTPYGNVTLDRQQ